MTLESSFYTLGIIFMTLMLLIVMGIVVGVFLIKKKIDHIHTVIQDKVANLAHTLESGQQTVRSVKNIFDKVKGRS